MSLFVTHSEKQALKSNSWRRRPFSLTVINWDVCSTGSLLRRSDLHKFMQLNPRSQPTLHVEILNKYSCIKVVHGNLSWHEFKNRNWASGKFILLHRVANNYMFSQSQAHHELSITRNAPDNMRVLKKAHRVNFCKFVCDLQNPWQFWLCKSQTDSDLHNFISPAVNVTLPVG